MRIDREAILILRAREPLRVERQTAARKGEIMGRVYFPQYRKGREGIEAFDGTILEHAQKLGVEIASECGGLGACGRCVVRIEKGSEALGEKTRSENWFCNEMGKLGVADRYIDASCGRVPRTILGRHYTDYSPERLKEIYEKANLKVLG